MKIVYISHLNGDGANGLSWSVPASIKAQAVYDEVFWLNTNKGEMNHWKEVPAFHNAVKSKTSLLKNLPKKFQNPDIVVFEGFYDSYLDVIWGEELRRKSIPYIIIPRSALTVTAMNNHAHLKKKIAHKLFYNRFIKGATAIHYLTDGEARETTKLFNNPYVIIPNGIVIPSCIKSDYSKKAINASFIGRIDIHQKGLDLLFGAIQNVKEKLISSNFVLTIYGPENQDYSMLKSLSIDMKLDDIIFFHDQVFGKEKESVLLDTDVFIMTSRFEGLPMGLIEALSYGIPCAVTDGTYMDKEIKEYDAGWTSDTTIEGITRMLECICDQKQLYPEKGGKARLLAHNYNWDVIAKRTHDEYMKLI